MQRTREHLESVNETYFEHMAHAGGFGFKPSLPVQPAYYTDYFLRCAAPLAVARLHNCTTPWWLTAFKIHTTTHRTNNHQ